MHKSGVSHFSAWSGTVPHIGNLIHSDQAVTGKRRVAKPVFRFNNVLEYELNGLHKDHQHGSTAAGHVNSDRPYQAVDAALCH